MGKIYPSLKVIFLVVRLTHYLMERETCLRKVPSDLGEMFRSEKKLLGHSFICRRVDCTKELQFQLQGVSDFKTGNVS